MAQGRSPASHHRHPLVVTTRRATDRAVTGRRLLRMCPPTSPPRQDRSHDPPRDPAASHTEHRENRPRHAAIQHTLAAHDTCRPGPRGRESLAADPDGPTHSAVTRLLLTPLSATTDSGTLLFRALPNRRRPNASLGGTPLVPPAPRLNPDTTPCKPPVNLLFGLCNSRRWAASNTEEKIVLYQHTHTRTRNGLCHHFTS